MDCHIGAAEEEPKKTGSLHRGGHSPEMERNPSPPPEAEAADAIGDTVYSKHWLFSTLTRVIQMVTKPSEEDSEGQMQLTDDDEEDLCRVWDMAMDRDVAGFLQEFKAPDILLGVIAKSGSPRLTEICVGILGNIACFPDSCLPLSQNEDLCAVLLLLFGDTDPPTLLEASRLILTCVSQKDVCALWLQRIRQQTSLRYNLLFIMRSSTNTDLLEKVGELVDKLFDIDEELMKSWITAQPSEEEGDDVDSPLDIALCLLEAAKQLRLENPNGLEVYLHIMHLLTTVNEGIQLFASSDGPGQAVWNFVCEIVCEDLCQPNELAIVVHEQKGTLVQAFSVLQALYTNQKQLTSKDDACLPLFGTILRVIHYQSEHKDEFSRNEDAQDKQFQTLAEITTEFLSDMCTQTSKDTVSALVKECYLTEKSVVTTFGCLLPNYKTSFDHLLLMLSASNPQMADKVKKHFPV
ncbi:protein saal1 [Nerophis ophidion]|uniref:protein saal1 n=1 Tax=Nerophis ophidion TaxID=159077 RepID=UPI002ADFB652|nr:protein saal1 [Nerophis ophidion]